jgi:chromosomal replication initiation ATPase DnaA
MRENGHAIMREIARKNGISAHALTSGNKSRLYAWPRQEAMYELFVRCTHLSIPAIAAIVGVSDPTTVRYGVAAHAARIGVPTPRMGNTAQRGWLSMCEAYQQVMRQAA